MKIRDHIIEEFFISFGGGKKARKYNEMLANVIDEIDRIAPTLLDKVVEKKGLKNSPVEAAQQAIDEFVANRKKEGTKVELGNWLRISSYAKKYNIEPFVVSQWIQSGKISREDIQTIPELDNLSLIRDIEY